MKPFLHAKNSARKFGGDPLDYLELHTWFDSTKAVIPDMRHRMILHNAFGIFISESVFGKIVQMPNGEFKRTSYIINSDGAHVQVRDLGEEHVLEDLGTIPTLVQCLSSLPLETWMGGMRKVTKITIPAEDVLRGLGVID